MPTKQIRNLLRKGQSSGHRVKYGGDEESGYWWECECGAGHGRHESNGPGWTDKSERTEAAHDHILERMILDE